MRKTIIGVIKGGDSATENNVTRALQVGKLIVKVTELLGISSS